MNFYWDTILSSYGPTEMLGLVKEPTIGMPDLDLAR